MKSADTTAPDQKEERELGRDRPREKVWRALADRMLRPRLGRIS